MAVGGHANAKLLSRNPLVVEAELLREARELRLIRGLLQEDKDQKRQQAERECETNDPADVGNSLEHHDEKGGRDSVDRKKLPFGNCDRHALDFGPTLLPFKAADRYLAETLGTSGGWRRS